MSETHLRRLRLAKKITLTALAEELGILPSRLSMIESGQRPAPPEIAEKIAKRLGVALSDLFVPESFTVREPGPL